MLVKAFIFIIAMVYDLMHYFCPLRLMPGKTQRKIRYTITKKNGKESSGLVIAGIRPNHRFSRKSDAFVCVKNRTIYYSDAEEHALTRRPFTLSDSGERIRIKGMRMPAAVLVVAVMLVMQHVILPMLYHQTIAPIASAVTEIPEVFLSHDFKNQTIQDENMWNILLIGSSGRLEESDKADTIMVLSIHRELRTVKLISLHRDFRVNAWNPNILTQKELGITPDDPNYTVLSESIPKNKWQKCKLGETLAFQTAAPDHLTAEEQRNAAYLSGVNVLVNTIEDNYKLPIDDIVCVDLYAFRDVLDALDGVEMELTEEYVMQMNIILAAEQNALFGAEDVIDIREDGIYHLNGNEALSYVRLRHVGDWSDIQRTERQRAFVKSLLEQKIHLFWQPAKINTEGFRTAASKVRTTLKQEEIYDLADILVNGGYTMKLNCTLPIRWDDYTIHYPDGMKDNYLYIPQYFPEIQEQTRTVLFGEE